MIKRLGDSEKGLLGLVIIVVVAFLISSYLRRTRIGERFWATQISSAGQRRAHAAVTES